MTTGPEGKHTKNQSYHEEQAEHWGKDAVGPNPPASVPAAQFNAHRYPAAKNSQGYGHDVTRRTSCGLRLSGHAGAHRIGKR